MKAVQGREITNEYYKVNASWLLAAIVAVEPHPGVHGELGKEIETPDSKFQKTLANLNPQQQFVVFLIRDDSFVVFRRARSLAEQKHFLVRWELMGPTERIKFGYGAGCVLKTE